MLRRTSTNDAEHGTSIALLPASNRCPLKNWVVCHCESKTWRYV